ncbi:MAG: HNH endonuclease [Candidatus Kapabacteria bacterium]|nr:HNH endonuclease [Ignavibacteriota bacterium]MCW5883699.1 HNH endonuclease [Candidatus Kapabacteria bacterium]
MKESTGLGGKVLVLNQSYEPVSLCSVRKAIVLLLLFKAEMVVERKNRTIRTINNYFPYPSVIKLMTYVKIPLKNVELSRKNVIKRDGNRCQYCNKNSIEMTIDHIIPRSRGGVESWENLITACVRCNNKKGNRTPEEAGMPLLSKPRKPNHIVFLKQHIGKLEESWKPFLFME